MQLLDEMKNTIFNLIPERIINRDKELKRVFTLFETYFKFTNITDFKNKYNIIKSVINNKILTEQEREKLFDIIRENQKLYLIICKLIHKYKFIKSKKFDNDFDLHGESLSCMPATQKITIYQENTRYEFKLTDIVNIIKHSLCKCDSFFVESENIKNPYTNIPFNKSTLYNIYFRLKETSINMPLLFDMFFKCGFDINKFKSTYEPYILDEHIKNYISDLPLNNQYKLCYEILFKYKKANRKLREFHFDRRYPKEKNAEENETNYSKISIC